MANWWQRFWGVAAAPAAEPTANASAVRPPAQRAVATDMARRLAGGRLSTDDFKGSYGGPLALFAPVSAESDWRTLELDSGTLDTLSPSELMELLADVSPDISRALWDFLRLSNPGWEARALRPGTDELDEAGQAALAAFIAALGAEYGSFDVVLNRLFVGAFLRGAFFAELVLDRRGRVPLDLVTPDPVTARFRRVDDPDRGPLWRLCQGQGVHIIDLNRPTILYVPVDPLPGSPYGRPLAAPALFSSLFLLGLLHDLRRVVAQQGYPRLDLAVSLERLMAAMPADLEADSEALKNWVAATISEVQTVFNGLQPDDAYIHTDVVTVNRPVGAVDASSLGGVDGLIKSLERMLTRALKTMPLLMADMAGASEANANRQWEVHAAGIKSLQHLAENLLSRLLTMALQAQGLPATVEFRFAELRAAEMLRDAQTENLQITNARAKYDAGWTSQDEAAEAVTGHAADVPEPRVAAEGGAGGLGTVNPEPGSNRARRSLVRRVRLTPVAGVRVKIIPEGAAEPLPEVPDEVALTDADVRRAIDAWDALMPAYAGLLEAVVLGQEDWDEQDRFVNTPAPTSRVAEDWAEWRDLNVERFIEWQDRARRSGRRAYGDDSPWEWDQPSKRYRDTETGRYMGSRQMLPLRDEFIDAQKAAASDLADRLAAGEITTNRYVEEMRGLIKTTYLDEYALAHGGRNNMTSRDFGIVGNMCRDQYSYLNNFAGEINAGDLSPAQIRARGRMYIESASQAYERAQAEVRGISGPHALPAYPGDGSTACRSNCRCSWEYRETETTWEATWTLHPAEHCEDCLSRASEWAPYVVAK